MYSLFSSFSRMSYSFCKNSALAPVWREAVSSVEPTLRPSVVLADEPTQPQVEPERVTGSGGRPKSASREGSMVTDRI